MSGESEPADRMFVFKELAGADDRPPRTIGFTDVDIKPLDFGELARARLHDKLTIPLEMFNGRILDTDIEGVDLSGYARFKTTLESPFTARAISLVPGGWLPSALAAHRARTVLLPDRNVVSEIVSRFEAGRPKGREPDFLDLFAKQPVRINPLLYALEGNSRSIPTPEAAGRQLVEAIDKLRKALPNAILQIGPNSLEGLLGLIEDSRPGLIRREAFLLRVAPVLRSPVGRARFDSCWNEVLEAADACAVERNSLVVLAALSCLAIPGGLSPARDLLKFKDGYGPAHAYNALADLRSLELFIRLGAEFPAEIIQFCTADKPLALFWAGIRVSNVTRKPTSAAFDLDPVDELMPADARERWREAIAGQTG